MVKVHKLGVVMALSAMMYAVRAVGRSGPGRTFHSEEIAKAWAAEQRMLTGTTYEIFEIQTGF